MALHIRQAEVTARKPIGELFMIQPQQVQHGRMQIMDVHSIFDCIPSPFVSRAVGQTASDTTASQPHCKTKWVMIAAVFSLSRWCPPKLTAPNDKRLIKETAGFKIGQQSGDRLIG